MSSIKTPDQRVRVFISSTIAELEHERKVAREAINKLRLIPVFFESGARPHPPRDLYRAYLEQSHIFVGIYWNSYGWIAPDMEISGLEDEFRLSGGKARLMYVKHSTERQPRLTELLHDIQNEAVTYQKFTTAEEFKELLENDLALLLSERFESQSQDAIEKQVQVQHNLPYFRTALIGREKELKSLKEMLFMPECGLITLTGAGGTGKSRLALELAHDVGDRFKDGVFFVPLASIADASLVAPNIMHALGLIDTGNQPIQETLTAFLVDKQILLVLDNFEHVLEAGSLISELLSACRQIKIVVTSRAPLHIRNERIFPVTPLANQVQTIGTQGAEDMAPSVQLFLLRAQEVNPSLQHSPENLETINEICKRLDGLPLAIELAAARMKLLTPVALLQRMSKSLDILSQGPRDLPARHQTIRATIDWSYNLLDESARMLFRHLAVFSDGWTLESSEAVIKAVDVHVDVLEDTDKLLNVGLIHAMESTAHSSESRFGMLRIVKEYALEMLKEKGEIAQAQLHHAAHFEHLLQLAQKSLWEGDPLPWLDRLDAEYQNISHAIAYVIETRNHNAAWSMIGALAQYWASRGRFSEAFNWMEMANVKADTSFTAEQVEVKHQASAMFARGLLTFLSGRFAEVPMYLERSIRQFEEIGFKAGIARAKTYLGAAKISGGDEGSAMTYLKEAMDLAEAEHEKFSFVMSAAFLGDIYTKKEEFEKARFYLSLAEEHGRNSPLKLTLAATLLQEASFYVMQDDYQKALAFCEESIATFLSSGFKSMKGWAQGVMGQSHYMTGDLKAAHQNFTDAISSGREVGDKSMILFGLMGCGCVAFSEKQYETAGTLLGVAEAIIRATGYAFWSTDRKLYQLLVKNLTEQLSEDDLKKYRAKGEGMSQEGAIGMAMGV